MRCGAVSGAVAVAASTMAEPPEGVWRGSGQAHLLDLVHGCGRGMCYSKKMCCEGARTLNIAGSCMGEVMMVVWVAGVVENWVLAG
jgi:hypothetical protein